MGEKVILGVELFHVAANTSEASPQTAESLARR